LDAGEVLHDERLGRVRGRVKGRVRVRVRGRGRVLRDPRLQAAQHIHSSRVYG
jgi:hypothetical protein